MSYEPIIIIKKSDLEKHRDKIELYYNAKEGSEKERVLKYLNTVLESGSIIIDNLELLLCHPELTSFNNAIRTQLMLWDVKYTVWG